MKRKVSIAIIGTRGIPAHYGGFETFAQELSIRLVSKGYKVTVYCRKGNTKWSEPYYNGVRLITFPTVKSKYFDTITHTFLCACHILFTKVDIVYFCNAINSIFIILPRLFGKKTIINVDGLEWKRNKWNRIGKLAYKISERLATIFADEIVTDSKAIQAYYKEKFNKRTNFLPYGADIVSYIEPGEVMKMYGLEKRNFILYLSRLEPENNAHVVVKAYEMAKGDIPLVIVGDAPYSKSYIEQLRSTTDKRIKFIGSIYGRGSWELRCNALIYIHGNEVGGTNPALLEAMASANCVIANGVSFNREVIGDAGLCFEPNNPYDLKNKIEYLIDNQGEIENFRRKAIERIKKYYNWDEIVVQYEKLFSEFWE